MKGLLLRDLYILSHPMTLLTYLMFISMPVTQIILLKPADNSFEDVVVFGCMICLMGSIIPIGYLSADENCRWSHYCVTVPVSKTAYVSEKYLMVLLNTLFFALLCSLMPVALACKGQDMVFGRRVMFGDWLLTVGIIAGLVLVLMSVCLPLVFKWGAQKGSFIFVFLFFMLALCLGIGYGLLTLRPDNALAEWMSRTDPLLPAGIALAASALIYTGSWLLSASIYRQREL